MRVLAIKLTSRHVCRLPRPHSQLRFRRPNRHPVLRAKRIAAKATKERAAVKTVLNEEAFVGLSDILDKVKFSKIGNLVPVIVQHEVTGELLMQAFADRAALSETMQTRLATFYSRSRKGRWCKGETSGNFIHVSNVYLDCDGDSVIYMGDPVGPSCHTGAWTCWFSEIDIDMQTKKALQSQSTPDIHHSPSTTLYKLEATIKERRNAASLHSESIEASKQSWTAKLMSDDDLLCSKVMEEAQELCATLKNEEGNQRTAEEMADVLYHCMVLLSKQGVTVEDVLKILRGRFGTSGVEEKRSRKKEESISK